MFKPGDVVEILEHAMFPKGKQFTIKGVSKCRLTPSCCDPCPGLIEFEEVPGQNHCFGWVQGETHFLCQLADFKLELPL